MYKMKKFSYLAVCIFCIGILTSGCGVHNSVNIKFDTHDNMIVKTRMQYKDEISEYVDLSELSPEKLKPSFDVKAKGIKITSKIEKLDQDLEARGYMGFSQIEECKRVSWGKDFSEISIVKPQKKGESILKTNNFIFFKKYNFAGTVVAPEQLVEKAENSPEYTGSKDPNSFLSANLSIELPANAKAIKTNADMDDARHSNSYYWMITYGDSSKSNVEIEFTLINWFNIISTIIILLLLAVYLLIKKNLLSDWRSFLSNIAKSLDALSKKEFKQEEKQTNIPSKKEIKSEQLSKKTNINNKKTNVFLIIVLIFIFLLGLGFFLSIPSICDNLIKNGIQNIYSGNPEKAVQLIDLAHRLSPNKDFTEEIYTKGIDEFGKNNFANGDAFMQMTLKLEPKQNKEFAKELTNKSISALESKQYAKATKLMEYALKFDEETVKKRSEDLHKKWQNLIISKKYDEALAYANIRILIDPKDEKAYANKGATFFEAKKYKESVEAYTKAINIKNGFAQAYLHRGTSYLFLKEYDKAIYDYKKSIELNTDQTQIALAKYFLGKAYLETKQYPKAIAIEQSAMDMFHYLGNSEMENACFAIYDSAIDYDCWNGGYCP